jgi:hypothetical protein
VKRFGGLTRSERTALSGVVGPLQPLPVPAQQRVTDERGLITVPWVSFFRWITAEGTAAYLEGTHAERMETDPADYRAGTWFYETDRQVTYRVRYETLGTPPETTAVWQYAFGTMRAALSGIPSGLTLFESGFLFYATDYAHTWRWTGLGWEYAPGDRASGEIGWFAADPGTGWALCNGTGTTRSLPNAGTAAFTTPNLIGRYGKGAAAYTGASLPGSGGSLTGAMAAAGDHAHTIPTFLTDNNGSSVTVQGGTGALVAPVAHQHYVSTNPPTSTTGSHTHGLGTLAVSGGEPAHIDLLPYYRL